MTRMAVMIFLGAAAWAQDSASPLVMQKLEEGLIAGPVHFVSGQMFNLNPVKGQPYSGEAVSEMTQTLADGNKIVTRSSTMIYRDSEGRERREETIGRPGATGTSGTPSKVVFISDPVAKVSYTLHSEDHTAEKIPAPIGKGSSQTVTKQAFAFTVRTGGAAGPPELPPPPMVFETSGRGGRGELPGKVEQLGTQTIEGVAADGTRTTTTIPAGQIGNERDIHIVSERWVSKELGVLVMSRRSDPRMGETVYRLTNVSRSEPAHSLFEVPADYTVTDAGRPVFLNKEDQ
jgi:hypothetical protein